MGNTNKTTEQPEPNAADDISTVISGLQECFENHNDIVRDLDNFVHAEKNAVEKLSQNQDAIRNLNNGEENADRIHTDGLDQDALVKINEVLQNRYTSLKKSVRSVVKSAIDTQIVSKQSGLIEALSDNGESWSSEPSKLLTQKRESRLKRDNNQQCHGNVSSESFNQDASIAITVHESNRKAGVQGLINSDQHKQNVKECFYEHYDNAKAIGRPMYIQNSKIDQQLQHEPVTGQKNTESFPCKDTLSDKDWRLIKDNYAHLKECVHDLVGNANDTKSKDKSDLIEPTTRKTIEDETSSDPNLLPATDKIVIKSNDTLEMQNSNQSRYREKVSAVVTPCVLVQLKQSKIENYRLKEHITKLTEENEKCKMKKEMQTKRPVQLQLYYKHNECLMPDVNALQKFLTREMVSYNVVIEIVQCTDSSHIKESIPVLVLCTYKKGYTFRADKALEGIKRTKRTMLLIFHPLDKKFVHKRKSEATASDLGGILDFAYLQNNSIYSFDKKSMGDVCEFIKEHMPVQLQLYHKRNDELMKAVVNELEMKIKCQMESVGVDIDLMRCTNDSELKPGIPVLVLCIVTSRVETDVENASTEIKLTNQTALVVFHHKDKHVKIMRTRDRVTGKDLGGIFDFAFLQNKGIYACDLNTKALENLRDFIAKTRG